jgi:hypothetical protein
MLKGTTAFVIGLLVAACSSSGDGSDAGSVAQACSDRATQYCSRLAACSPERVQIDYGDQPTCVTRMTDNCTSSLALPGTGNSAAIADACSLAYSTWACEDFLDGTNVPQACQQVTGSVQTGSPCAAPGQCTTGFCAIVPGALCGVCATAPVAGDSCAELTSCGQGLDCTTDTHTCAAVGVAGASCGKGAPCGALFTCIGYDAATKTGPGCDHNTLLTCNTQTKQCATMTIAAGGQPCGTDVVADQTVLCGTHGTCTGASATAAGTCTAAAADGAACDLDNGPPCLLDARCVVTSDASTAGTCQPLNPTACP